MFDYLIDHAIKNVWCTPDQDNQLILRPKRITPLTGALNHFKVMWRHINMPLRGERFHVFQIGQVHPLILGLFSEAYDWVNQDWMKVSDACTKQNMIADVYTDLGVQVPRHEVYYMYTSDRDLILAVKENPMVRMDYQKEDLYIRFYTNAYFNSIRSDQTTDGVYVNGGTFKNTDQILAFQNEYDAYKTKQGLVNAYVNGYFVDKIDLFTVKINDTAEFIYDSSVHSTVTFDVKDLGSFDSSLDLKRKYLLHYPTDSYTTIEYHDDVDFFIINPSPNGRYYGTYYHKNQEDAVRMVTHRDYSLSIPYFTHYFPKLQEKTPTVVDANNLKIRCHIRKSGYLRPLIFDNNRIFELYKLDSSHVEKAMLGMDAVVPVWRAENLEASAYTQIMRSKSTQINREMIQDGYGYNSISKLLGDSPLKTYLFSGRQQVIVPYGLQLNSTAYEYDSEGLLLGNYTHVEGAFYNTRNFSTRYVEFFSGLGGYKPDNRFGEDNIQLPSKYNYRVYMCHKTLLDTDEVWRDITGSEYYEVVDGVLKWTNLDFNQYLMVKTDARFLSYNLNIKPLNGNLRFKLSEIQNRDGLDENRIMSVPMGDIDVFLNGHSLIEGLDYRVEFPEISIINKRYLINPETDYQSIHVRFTGFCTPDLKHELPEDRGFIVHGVLSNNNKFDLRDDKVLRIVVNGQLKHRDDLVFSELHSGVNIINTINGLPYQIKDIVVPLRDMVNDTTYTLRQKSKEIDKSVSDYLTLKLPQPTRDAPSAIEQRYEVFSPFVCKILNDLITEDFDLQAIERNLSDNEIIDLCRPYEEWLKYDPINPETNYDFNYVIVHPHNLYNVVYLSFFKLRFLRRVVELYGNGRVELSPFVALEAVS